MKWQRTHVLTKSSFHRYYNFSWVFWPGQSLYSLVIHHSDFVKLDFREIPFLLVPYISALNTHKTIVSMCLVQHVLNLWSHDKKILSKIIKNCPYVIFQLFSKIQSSNLQHPTSIGLKNTVCLRTNVILILLRSFILFSMRFLVHWQNGPSNLDLESECLPNTMLGSESRWFVL